MATAYQDIPIDPALQAERSSRSNHATTKLAGTKRKARGSISASGSAPAPAAPSVVAGPGAATLPTTPQGRVTRRSAAAAAASTEAASVPGIGVGARSTQKPKGKGKEMAPGEPARGEEENLIEAPWDKSNQLKSGRNTELTLMLMIPQKRARRESPVKPVKAPPAASAAALSKVPNGVPPALPTSSSGRLPLPYPIGLTPFRYPCLTPHLPAPPPGDPNAPGFKRFDPSATSPPVSTAIPRRLPPRSSDRTAPPDSGTAAALPGPSGSTSTNLAHPPAAAPPPNLSALPPPSAHMSSQFSNPDPAGQVDPQPDPDFELDPTYASITALLSASQLPFSIDPSWGGYPRSPGERSDGKAGPLSPKLVGRYTMGSKDDCDDCKAGTDGHWGHWVKSDTGFHE
ncbi:hypothetical protein JCM24511_00121 [Saitozyma sp. JCM 24511]|nr:hypothetical protein JCM24511_00121 [Saitozyma sp. JCM 24511]